MKSSLPPKIYEAPNPGLYCPECHSDNTAFSCKENSWTCFNCSELFKMEEVYQPKCAPPRLIGYTEEGAHWYQKANGSVVLISKEIMKEGEDVHLRPKHGWAHYDPTEEYNWILLWEEVDKRAQAEDFLRTLSPGQINQLKEQLNAT